MDPPTRTFFAAGVKFRPRKDIEIVQHDLLDGLVEEKFQKYPVTLVGEPSNPYDKYAVKVLAGGTHIGYIPRPLNIDVWSLRDGGLKPTAKLVGYDPDAVTHEMFKIEVSFIKP